MPIIDIQRKGRQLGRIRIGVQVDTGKTRKNGAKIYRPEKIETFRFTTPSRAAADAVAGLLGGTVQPWTPEGGSPEWEVITGVTELPVMVPPGDQAISQWYEMWSAGGCQRRCDGVTEQLTQNQCLCPHADDPDDAEQLDAAARQRAELAKKNPPEACKPTTRLNVILPDLPDIGVWRLDSHGFYSAVELGGAAELLAQARAAGVVLPATLRLEQRSVKRAGQTRRYAVPVLEIGASLRQLTTGGGPATLGDSLPAAPRPVAALEAAPTGGQSGSGQAPGGGPRQGTAQQLADLAAAAATPEEVRELGAAAREEKVLAEQVTVGGQSGHLEGYLRARIAALAAAEAQRHEFVHDGEGGSKCAKDGCGQFEDDERIHIQPGGGA